MMLESRDHATLVSWPRYLWFNSMFQNRIASYILISFSHRHLLRGRKKRLLQSHDNDKWQCTFVLSVLDKGDCVLWFFLENYLVTEHDNDVYGKK